MMQSCHLSYFASRVFPLISISILKLILHTHNIDIHRNTADKFCSIPDWSSSYCMNSSYPTFTCVHLVGLVWWITDQSKHKLTDMDAAAILIVFCKIIHLLVKLSLLAECIVGRCETPRALLIVCEQLNSKAIYIMKVLHVQLTKKHYQILSQLSSWYPIK